MTVYVTVTIRTLTADTSRLAEVLGDLRRHCNSQVVLADIHSIPFLDACFDPRRENVTNVAVQQVDDPLARQLAPLAFVGQEFEHAWLLGGVLDELTVREALILRHSQVFQLIARENCRKNMSIKDGYLHFRFPVIKSFKK